MNNKNKDLSTAVVVLSAIALGFQVFCIMALGLFWSMNLIISEFAEIFSMLVGMVAIYVIASLALHILALVFAVKGVKQNLHGYILTASILNTVCLIFGDLVSTAAAVCGYILYYYMKEEDKTDETQDKDIDGGLNIYKDNIYGMK